MKKEGQTQGFTERTGVNETNSNFVSILYYTEGAPRRGDVLGSPSGRRKGKKGEKG